MDVLPIHRPPCARETVAADLRGLDTLRVAASFGVVALHCCVPYLQHPMPGLAWPVRDTASPLLDVAFWGIEVFIMPVFLVIAGMLAWQSLQRRGPGPLWKARTKRLGRPLLFGLCVVLPVDLYIWVGGWVYEGHVDAVKLKSMKIDGPLGDQLWGTAHLWFLVYLLTYVTVLAAISSRLGGNTSEQDNASRDDSSFPLLMPATLLVVAVVTLLLRSEVVWGFQHGFVPVPSKWIYSGTFFAGGVLIARYPQSLEWLRVRSGRGIALATTLLAVTVILGRWQLAGHSSSTPRSIASLTLLAALTPLAAWVVTLAMIGWSIRANRRIGRTFRYLAAASFWIYLIHHPLVGLIHIDLKYLMPAGLPVTKALIALVVSVGVSLLTYEALIRRTAAGRWLGLAWTPGPAAREESDAGQTRRFEVKPPLRRAA